MSCPAHLSAAGGIGGGVQIAPVMSPAQDGLVLTRALALHLQAIALGSI